MDLSDRACDQCSNNEPGKYIGENLELHPGTLSVSHDGDVGNASRLTKYSARSNELEVGNERAPTWRCSAGSQSPALAPFRSTTSCSAGASSTLELEEPTTFSQLIYRFVNPLGSSRRLTRLMRHRQHIHTPLHSAAELPSPAQRFFISTEATTCCRSSY